MVFDRGRQLRARSQPAIPRSAAARARAGRGLLDRSHRGHQRAVRCVRRGDRLRHAAERDGGSAGVPRAYASGARAEAAHYAWWSEVARRELAPSRRARQRPRARANMPVVHVAYEDALAYARWLGRSCRPRSSGSTRPRRTRSMALHREPRDARGKPARELLAGRLPDRRTRAKTASRRRRRSAALRPTRLACTTCSATSGSGPALRTRARIAPRTSCETAQQTALRAPPPRGRPTPRHQGRLVPVLRQLLRPLPRRRPPRARSHAARDARRLSHGKKRALGSLARPCPRRRQTTVTG